MKFFQFFITRYFWTNLGLSALILLILGFVSSLMLKSCTNHGEKIEIPDLKGIHIEKVAEILSQKNLRYQIIDTVYFEDLPALTVVEQNPAAKSFVKGERVIYVSLNAASAPSVVLPELSGKSLRIATALLEGLGLQVGAITYQPDFADGQVIKMLYNAGTSLKKGTAVPLEVGKSESDEMVEVPDLINLSLKEAKEVLDEKHLNETHIFDESVTDTAEATVYKTRPSKGKEVNGGSIIDLFLK